MEMIVAFLTPIALFLDGVLMTLAVQRKEYYWAGTWALLAVYSGARAVYKMYQCIPAA